MRNRAEVVELISKQLYNESEAQRDKGPTHYGRVELMELMDFVYEAGPASSSEEIPGFSTNKVYVKGPGG